MFPILRAACVHLTIIDGPNQTFSIFFFFAYKTKFFFCHFSKISSKKKGMKEMLPLTVHDLLSMFFKVFLAVSNWFTNHITMIFRFFFVADVIWNEFIWKNFSPEKTQIDQHLKIYRFFFTFFHDHFYREFRNYYWQIVSTTQTKQNKQFLPRIFSNCSIRTLFFVIRFYFHLD